MFTKPQVTYKEQLTLTYVLCITQTRLNSFMHV